MKTLLFRKTVVGKSLNFYRTPIVLIIESLELHVAAFFWNVLPNTLDLFAAPKKLNSVWKFSRAQVWKFPFYQDFLWTKQTQHRVPSAKSILRLHSYWKWATVNHTDVMTLRHFSCVWSLSFQWRKPVGFSFCLWKFPGLPQNDSLFGILFINELFQNRRFCY